MHVQWDSSHYIRIVPYLLKPHMLVARPIIT